MKIEELNMSERTTKALKLNQIHTTEDLENLTADDLLKFRNFGRMSMFELIDKMKEMNLSFKETIY